MIINSLLNLSIVTKLKFVLPNNYKIAYFSYIFLLVVGLLLQLIGISSLAPLFSIYFGSNVNLDYLSYINSFLDINNFDKFNFVFVTMVIAIIMSNLIFLFSTYLSAKIAFAIERDIRSKLFNFYLLNSYSDFIKTETSAFLSILINETQRFTSQVLIPFADIISRVILASGILFFLLFVAFEATLILIFFLFSFYIIFFLNIKKKIKKNNYILSEQNKNLIKITNDIVKSFREIKIYNLENKYLDQLITTVSKIQKIRFFTTFFSISPRYYLEIILILSLYFFYFYNKSNSTETLDLSLAPVFGYAFFKILPSLQGAFAQYIVIKSNINSLYEIYKFMSLMSKAKIEKKANVDFLNKNFNSLEFKNLEFKYENKNIFNNINFKIKKSDKIGIIGSSGVGKSTLLYILTGLLNVKKSEIYLNEVKSSSAELLLMCKKLLAIIPQNPTLLQDTILNNILLDKKLDQIKLKKILKFAEAENFIESLDNKLNTILHSTNNNLSGGQIQRIALARALYRNPQLLIIDEGFNQLDLETEYRLLNKILNNKNLTVIIVYHKIPKNIKLKKIFCINNFKLNLITNKIKS